LNKKRVTGKDLSHFDPKGRRNEKSHKQKWDGLSNNKPKIKGEGASTI
jgi:hypothetical protein